MLTASENCAGHLPYFLQLFLCNAHEKDILYLLKCWEEEKVELSYAGLNLLILLALLRSYSAVYRCYLYVMFYTFILIFVSQNVYTTPYVSLMFFLIV